MTCLIFKCKYYPKISFDKNNVTILKMVFIVFAMHYNIGKKNHISAMDILKVGV